MRGIVLKRYLLFVILGIETLTLPLFLSKDLYGEIEFIKQTALLAQFGLLGAGTGYTVLYLNQKESIYDHQTQPFVLIGLIHSLFIGGGLFLFFNTITALTAAVFCFALIIESALKVRQRYVIAMSFKPLLAIVTLSLLPLLVTKHIIFPTFVVASFSIAIIIFIAFAAPSIKGFNRLTLNFSIYKYGLFIKEGFIINSATALTFLLFYIDRMIIKTQFSQQLADYSLSFSITQIAIVAITTFSYVNIIEFGKQYDGPKQLKERITKSIFTTVKFYIPLGLISIIFSYFAEHIYGYDKVFETTTIMVTMFGIANVLISINSAHLYLGTVPTLATMVLSTLVISVTLNAFIPFGISQSYYLMIVKTYGIFLVFSITSALFVFKKLQTYSHI